MSHPLLNWLVNFSSDNEVAVVAIVDACFAGRRPLKAHPAFNFTAHGAILLSDFLNSHGGRMS